MGSFIPSHWFIIIPWLSEPGDSMSMRLPSTLLRASTMEIDGKQASSATCFEFSFPFKPLIFNEMWNCIWFPPKKKGFWKPCSLQVLGPLLGRTRRTPACHSWKARASSAQFLGWIGQESWTLSTPNQTDHWQPTSEQHARELPYFLCLWIFAKFCKQIPKIIKLVRLFIESFFISA